MVQQMYAGLGNTPDLELIAQLFAPDFQYHLIYGSVIIHGPEGRKAFENIYWSVYSHRHHIVEALVPVGETVVTRWTWTTSGYDHDPTGNPFTASPEETQSVSGTTIWRIVDGKIADAWIILE